MPPFLYETLETRGAGIGLFGACPFLAMFCRERDKILLRSLAAADLRRELAVARGA